MRLLGLLVLSCNYVCADITFVSKESAFVAGDDQTRFKIGAFDGLTGWHSNKAYWGQTSFVGYQDQDPVSLWVLIDNNDQDYYVISTDASQGDIAPSRFHVPEDKKVRVTEDTLIDGHGCTLVFEQDASLVIDNNVTLTLRNMSIQTTRNDFNNPIILPNGNNAQVTLQDVKIVLADDFSFKDGQLFILGDVLISGQHLFAYQSTQSSCIFSGATFGFDIGTTFFYDPPIAANHLIQMQDNTATLFLDNATLVTTHTGIRLSKGTLCLDNSVTLKSFFTRKPVSLTNEDTKTISSKGIKTVAWSPDGNYLAVGVDNNEEESLGILLYRFDESSGTLTLVDSIDEGSYQRIALDWSPEGDYLAVGTMPGPSYTDTGIEVGHELQVFQFNSGPETLTGVASKTEGVRVRTISWSSNGQYLAVGTNIGPRYFDTEIVKGDELQLFRFDTTTTPTLIGVDSKNENAHISSVAWRFDSKYLAVGTIDTPIYSDSGIYARHKIQVFGFDNDTQVLAGVTSWDNLADINMIQWSADGKYIATGQFGPLQVHVYPFDDKIENFVWYTETQALDVYAFSWSPERNYLIAGGFYSNGQSDSTIEALYFDGATLVPGFQDASFDSRVSTVSWRSDGNFLAVGAAETQDATDADVRVYRVNYVPQPIDTGIIFGDSSIIDGSGNLNVQVLGGAHVDIVGVVADDSV